MLIAHQQVVSALSSGLKLVVDLQPCTLKESHTSGFLLVLVSKLMNSKVAVSTMFMPGIICILSRSWKLAD